LPANSQFVRPIATRFNARSEVVGKPGDPWKEMRHDLRSKHRAG
jgi:hypothetical protein